MTRVLKEEILTFLLYAQILHVTSYSRRCMENYGGKVCRTAARANLLFLCSLNMQISRIFNAVDIAYTQR